MLKAYFDGSGKTHDPNCQLVTLGGYIAPEMNWSEIEPAWQSVLANHKDPECPKSSRGNYYFHSKEAFHRQDGYQGWTGDQIYRLVFKLIGVLNSFGRMGAVALSCSVNKSDYEKVKTTIPRLRSIHHICLDHCIGTSFRHEESRAGGITQILFDRKEEFEPILRQVWNTTHNGNRIWWAKQVASIIPIDDAKDSPATQAADLLAWVTNRYYTHGNDDKYGRFLFSLSMANLHCHVDYDEIELRTTFNPDGTMKQGTGPNRSHIKAPSGTRVAFRVSPTDVQ